MRQRPTLHILGGGRTASAIARCLFRAGAADIGLIVNRSLSSSRRAVDFIGAGQAASPADADLSDGWLMLGLPDSEIESQANSLAEQLASPPGLVFHLSGSIAATKLAAFGCPAAAVHPLRAFADPEQAADRFSGTWCVAEGDSMALAALEPAFTLAGARWLAFAARNKQAWHAATVAASNFLVTINALARELAAAAGMPEADATRLIADLQAATLASLLHGSAADALTGPIERADAATCLRILEVADAELDREQSRLFRQLFAGTLRIAQVKRGTHASDHLIEFDLDD